jgi:hypothetical protein
MPSGTNPPLWGENCRSKNLLATLALLVGLSAQTTAFADDAQPSAQEVLQARIQTIELDREASAAQFRADKKACAATILVSRCTSEALVRRRGRDAVLRDGQISAKEQLRFMAAKSKNADLASIQARAIEQSGNEAQRQAGLAQRAKKLADAQERMEAHQLKKSQEEENRRLYLEKVQRAEEKQAEIRARFKDSAIAPKAGGTSVPTPASAPNPAIKPAATVIKPGATASAN